MSQENGWKFELFLHDCFTMISANRFGVLECDRNTEFAPVKNAETENVDTPSIARMMLLTECGSWMS